MNRRSFLQFLGAATVATAAGIELIDTAKTFFLPPSGGWHQSADLSFGLGEFARRILDPVIQSLASQIDEEMMRFAFPKIGQTINVHRPPRFVVYQPSMLQIA